MCVVLSSIFMFIMMTENLGLLLAVILGNIFGYYYFSLDFKTFPKRTTDEGCICHT